MAASTVFVMLYLGAIEGGDYFVKPDQVVRMDDRQAGRTSREEREAWRQASVISGGPGGWYAKNTREPIRDETLRQGLVHFGAAIEREGVPTTSPIGRYALKGAFADLFNPHLAEPELQTVIAAWRRKYLSPAMQARLRLLKVGAAVDPGGVLVTFPNGETRRLASGPSSRLAKAVAETFAPTFLKRPGVLWLSESGRRETYRDVQLLAQLGISVSAGKLAPDLILVDLGEETEDPVFVFVELVATDGPITEERREALLALATSAGYSSSQAVFVTAFLDRSQAPFKRSAPVLAWKTYVWFATEPTNLVGLLEAEAGRYLIDLHRLPG